MGKIESVCFLLHDFGSSMQKDFFILIFVQRFAVINLAASLNHHLVEFEFDRLAFNHFLLYSVFAHQSVDIDILLLADTMGPVHCLQINLRVKIRIEKHYVVGSCQVDSKSAGSCRDQKD